ncbi:VWA domain-containing protein [Iamia sp. SCSIO 61187]|uniref:substrate-binding domain-containing protein n=1 Tax=Iamia sp. SCSIO 61187 TaxID=2722752 RepID=UPI001C628352|nr:extracellular solute-binding protein [Iamia sp. SCSIO 61187]QYG93488.1 VWA domain-containing protein [Iamia sp. SCSIO 61187]
MRTRLRVVGGLAIAALLVGATACSDDEGPSASVREDGATVDLGDPGDCVVVDLAVSSEKATLMTELAREFNGSDAAELEGGRCAFARPQTKASGLAADLLSTEWDEDAEGPRPVVWSPAASSWGAIVNQRRAAEGLPEIVGEADPFMQTPLVIAMPEPMADALGYPEEPVGWADIIRLSQDPQGWAALGHPEWGPFRLGKTNPNFSTSGLSALIAQAYASAGKTEGLSGEDLAAPAVEESARAVESAVVHYGDTTLTFLNNWYRTDERGTSLTYVSAAAVEEKSVIDYNRGNPDGNLDPGERPQPPRIPLVAVYPEEGTIYSDNPFIVLDAEWVSEEERLAAGVFEDFVKAPENQEKVLEFGFRPGNPDVALADPISADLGVDPGQPATLLETPAPEVMVELLDRWAEQRKSARVTIVLDVSGSMGDPATPDGPESKLDLAKQAAITALDQFKDDDEVGLRIFTTGLGGDGTASYVDLAPPEPIAQNRERLRREIDAQLPREGTPLYETVQDTFDEAVEDYDPLRINAVVVLSDGVNEDLDSSDDEEQLDELIASLRESSSSELAKPIRIFPIVYGESADEDVLRRIAEASNSTVYDASDPATIDRVFAAVVSNF